MNKIAQKFYEDALDHRYVGKTKVDFNKMPMVMNKYSFKIQGISILIKNPLRWSILCVNEKNEKDAICIMATDEELNRLKVGIRRLRINEL